MNVLADHLSSDVKKNLFGNADYNMLWSCQAYPQFCYRVHVPDSYSREEQPPLDLMVVIHGTGCAVENYVEAAREWADNHQVAVLAPLFPRDSSTTTISTVTSCSAATVSVMISSCWL